MRFAALLAGFAGVGAMVALAFVGSGFAGDAPHWKVWLCSPGAGRDWCYIDLAATRFDSVGHATIAANSVPKARPVDCFYVYPTVSEEKRGNSDLRITVDEQDVAAGQAAQFERVCRVFAPMYHQVPGGGGAYHPNYELEYTDVLTAWRDYLAHHNQGRGVVLIGHSEGAFLLKRLIREQIERSPSQRKLLVSAILLGGEVTVADGSDTGGSFRSVRACRAATQVGCVIAYSSWDRTPPKDAGLQYAPKGQHILCVNPAGFGASAVRVTPLFPWFESDGLAPPFTASPVTTDFIEFPGLYSARCMQQGSRAWLLVKRATGPGDPRPTPYEAFGPRSGLHGADMNVALVELLRDVRTQSKAWLEHH